MGGSLDIGSLDGDGGKMKPILRAMAGETLPTPPVWLMRQAGRYLPEYRATRARAGDFLTLCHTPELAAEVTLQPIRRFGFDAAILFADILLVPQALGVGLTFAEGEGPRLEIVATPDRVAALAPPEAVREGLAAIAQTLRLVRPELPAQCTLIGFAGAPWTVASYMVAGQGTLDQAPAHRLKEEDRATFTALIDRLTLATIEYLAMQAEAGAEVLKLFDSWAGSLLSRDFDEFAVAPVRRIIAALKIRHPEVPVIAFPRGAGQRYAGFAATTRADCLALDSETQVDWAVTTLQPESCVQGNLDPRHLVTGGPDLLSETQRIVAAFSRGPHIFNLGHGITPDADPDNVARMLEVVRGG